MLWLDVEIPVVDETPKFADASLGELAACRERWRVRTWEPYRRGGGAVRVVVLTAVIATHDMSEEFSREKFQLETGARLFDQILDLYMAGGLESVYQFAKHVNSTRAGLTYHTRSFVNDSIALLEELVGGLLKELEREATTAAEKQIAEQLDAVGNLLGCFKDLDNLGDDPKMGRPRFFELEVGRLRREGPPPPIGAKDRLYELYATCFHLKRSIDGLQKSIDERNSRDGGGTSRELAKKRSDDPYRQQRVDQYLEPQRKLVAKFLKARSEIENIFPAAAYVLEHLEEDILSFLPIERQAMAGRVDYRASRDVQLKYDSRIYWFLKELEVELEAGRHGLTSDGAGKRIDEYLRFDVATRITQLGGLHKHVLDYCLSKRPGLRALVSHAATQGILGVYFTVVERRRWSSANRVLGNLGVVFRLEERYRAELPSLRGIVLTCFRIDLERHMAQMSIEEERSNKRWHHVEVVFAIAGLLVAAIAVPFGAGAVGVPAGLTLALSIVHTALALFGMVLIVKSLSELLEANLQARDDLQLRLIEAGQSDPEALRDFGAIAARNRELLRAATSGMAIELLTLAIAHELKPIAYALDIEGYLGDVEMLQQSTGIVDDIEATQGEDDGE